MGGRDSYLSVFCMSVCVSTKGWETRAAGTILLWHTIQSMWHTDRALHPPLVGSYQALRRITV